MNIHSPNECMPLDPATLTADMYQLTVSEQIVYDIEADTERQLDTIRGLPAGDYMLLGAQEEFVETFEPDVAHSYNRFARLVVPSSIGFAGTTPAADTYHVREFGDLSWYGANLLTLNRIRLASVLGLGGGDVCIADIDAFIRQYMRDDEEGHWEHSGLHFFKSAKVFLRVAEDLQGAAPDIHNHDVIQRRSMLGMTAGNMFVSMSLVLQSKFDSSLAEAMVDNIVKVDRRRRENKIFAAGGDTR